MSKTTTETQNRSEGLYGEFGHRKAPEDGASNAASRLHLGKVSIGIECRQLLGKPPRELSSHTLLEIPKAVLERAKYPHTAPFFLHQQVVRTRPPPWPR